MRDAPSGASRRRLFEVAFGRAPLEEDGPLDAPAAPEGGGGTELGKYLLLEPLGRGGSGTVFRAYDRGFGRFVALKRLDRTVDAADLERFLREARTAARLEHPGIVKIYDVGSHEGQPYYAMELVPGRTLGDLASSLAVSEVVKLGAQVARALHHAHERGIVHRDVKPSNIVITPDGRAVLVDFGLAREVAPDTLLTRTGAIAGTPAYMSPEQARGRRVALDGRTDVYGLGATLYHALTGALPHAGETPLEVVTKVLTETPRAPRALRAELSPELEAILLQALAREPADRHPTALALADDLEAALGGRPVRAATARDAALRRRRVGVALRGAGVLFAVAAVAFGLSRLLSAPRSNLSIEIDEPAEGARLPADETVIVKGRVRGARPGMWLRVAERATDDEGRFAVPVLVERGRSFIELVARGSDGSEARARRAVVPVTPVLEQWYLDEAPPFRPALPPSMKTARSGAMGVYEWSRGGLTLELVFVPPGEFFMGSAPRDWRPPDVTPHRHAMPRGYWIGRTEITNAQYEVYCAATGRPRPRAAGYEGWPRATRDHPVTGITWAEARAFCEWLGLRLPAEAEWEKAARGTKDDRTFPWGDANPGLEPLANFCDLSCPFAPAHPDWMVVDGGRPVTVDDGHPFTSEVAAFAKDLSPYGARGMAGNVAEWCEDWYEADVYARHARGDFAPPASSATGSRVVRGGSWAQPWWNCKVYTRKEIAPSFTSAMLGFRVALSEPLVAGEGR